MDTDRSPSSVVVTSTPAELIAAGFLARYPKGTRDGYQIHLRQWFAWCTDNGVVPLDAQRMHIEAWARHLEEVAGLQRSTVASKLNAVCGLYRFAHLDGHLAHDPAAHVRRPSIEFVSKSQALSKTEAFRLLDAARDEHVVSHALVCLLLLNGLRISEALGADIEHLGDQDGYSTLFVPHRKGGKTSMTVLSIRSTLSVHAAIGDRTAGPVLLGRDGARLKVKAARRTISRLCRAVGVDKRITPHSLRHTWATVARQARVPDETIRRAGGWAPGSKMLAYYDRSIDRPETNPTHAVTAAISSAA